MTVSEQCFAVLPDGSSATLFTIYNDAMAFSLTNYGCCITSILLPSKTGGYDDVVLGYSDFSGYVRNRPYFGALIGRCAGRIADAQFSVDGQHYLLTPNDGGKHCLHSGYPSYSKLLWDAESFCDTHRAGVILTRKSFDGEQGFPGELDIQIVYSLSEDNEISLEYKVTTSKTTPINFTNHSYFNLNPAGMSADGSFVSVANHTVQIFANSYAKKNVENIPTGELHSVDNTSYDFREAKILGDALANLDNIGYDDTWIIRENIDDQKALAAIVCEPVTGRQLWVYSTQPALTMYTANFLSEEYGKNGDCYNRYAALCLESQHIPDAVHHPNFHSVLLKPNEYYKHETVWLFKL